MKSTSLADECQVALYQYQLRTKHPMEFPTNSISIHIYIYNTTQHQPSAPIQESQYGTFFKMKGHSIHHSINEQDCRWWNDAISTYW